MGSLKDSVVPEFKNMKFRIKDEEHSKKVQDFLLNLGYRWGRGFTETFIRGLNIFILIKTVK